MQDKEKLVMFCVIIVLLAFGCGFLVGVESTIKQGVHLIKVLQADGTLNVTWDDAVLENLIRRYVNSAQLG